MSDLENGIDHWSEIDWQPGCSLRVLTVRAEMLTAVRGFFGEQGVLEVETPLLSSSAGTDPNLAPFVTRFDDPASPDRAALYLNSSPELAMKRLLAAGSGSIFQICKAFRNEEVGRLHNPEFSILEWYRLGFNLDQLIDEIASLMGKLLAPILNDSTQLVSYTAMFKKFTGIDPLVAKTVDFVQCAKQYKLPEAIHICMDDRPLWLDFLFSHLVQPHLGKNRLCFVRDYPACQSALARLKKGDSRVSERVELFVNGLELANGFYELADPEEQKSRFNAEMSARKMKGLPVFPVDNHFVAALNHGLPDCSGVAVGLDRVLMLMTRSSSLDQVMSFSIRRA